MTNILGNSILTILLGIAYIIALVFIFSKSRKVRTKFKQKSVLKEAKSLLEIEETPLNKNNEINWEYLYKQIKKHPDSREKFLLLRQIDDQIAVKNNG